MSLVRKASAAEELKRAANQIAIGAVEAAGAAQESLAALTQVSAAITRQSAAVAQARTTADGMQALAGRLNAEVQATVAAATSDMDEKKAITANLLRIETDIAQTRSAAMRDGIELSRKVIGELSSFVQTLPRQISQERDQVRQVLDTAQYQDVLRQIVDRIGPTFAERDALFSARVAKPSTAIPTRVVAKRRASRPRGSSCSDPFPSPRHDRASPMP